MTGLNGACPRQAVVPTPSLTSFLRAAEIPPQQNGRHANAGLSANGRVVAQATDRNEAARLVAEATGLLTSYWTETEADQAALAARLDQTAAEIWSSGAWTPSSDELAWAARVAWRNADRCLGRLYWRSLVVRDRRLVRTADELADDLVRHLSLALNGGRIRAVVTVFAPGVEILNEQLVGYAGYQLRGGRILGDPRHVEITELARTLGWPGGSVSSGARLPFGRFDLLPIVLRIDRGPWTLHELPHEVVREVRIGHPELSWFGELGLRWYCTPVIANMPLRLTAGTQYTAPFGGWYLGTEIACRDLADADRYDALPAIAARLGLDTSNRRTLWMDRAEHELNRAVLWSFDRAGVTLADHHSESERFLAFVRMEERAGRTVRSDWSWIVPPQASARLGVYHAYQNRPDPNVMPSYTRTGSSGCPVH